MNQRKVKKKKSQTDAFNKWTEQIVEEKQSNSVPKNVLGTMQLTDMLNQMRNAELSPNNIKSSRWFQNQNERPDRHY